MGTFDGTVENEDLYSNARVPVMYWRRDACTPA